MLLDRPKCEVTGKRGYIDETAAQKQAKLIRKRCKAKLYPYQCPYCLGWHVGHRRKPVNRRKGLYTANAQAHKMNLHTPPLNGNNGTLKS